MKDEIVKILTAIVLVLVFVIPISFSSEKNKQIDIELQNKIIKEIDKIKPQEIVDFFRNNPTVQNNPEAELFAVKYAEKKWGSKLDENSMFYLIAGNIYIKSEEFSNAYNSFRKAYKPDFYMEPGNTELIDKKNLESEVFAISKLRDLGAFDPKLSMWVYQKAKLLSKKYDKIGKEQPKSLIFTINAYENEERKKRELKTELEQVKRLAEPHFQKLSEIFTNKDKKSLKNYLEESLISKDDFNSLVDIIYNAFTKNKIITFKIIKVVKRPRNIYEVYYTWAIDGGEYETLKPDEVAFASIEFLLINNKLVLVSF